MDTVRALSLALCAVVMASCSKPGEAPPTDVPSAPADVPSANEPLNLHKADYRLEGVTHQGFGEPRAIVITHFGKAWRLDIPGQDDISFLFDYANNRQTLLGRAESIAIYGPIGFGEFQTLELYNFWFGMPVRFSALPGGAPKGRFAGSGCTALGEKGFEWLAQGDVDGDAVVCVSKDGIPLKAASHSGRVLWEATAVARSPQDPKLFETPETYRSEPYTPDKSSPN